MTKCHKAVSCSRYSNTLAYLGTPYVGVGDWNEAIVRHAGTLLASCERDEGCGMRGGPWIILEVKIDVPDHVETSPDWGPQQGSALQCT